MSYCDENWMMLGIFISLARDIKRVTNKEKDEMYLVFYFLVPESMELCS